MTSKGKIILFSYDENYSSLSANEKILINEKYDFEVSLQDSLPVYSQDTTIYAKFTRMRVDGPLALMVDSQTVLLFEDNNNQPYKPFNLEGLSFRDIVDK